MKLTKEEVITITITPKDLRLIADDIESRMDNVKNGDDLPGHAFYKDGLKVILAPDEEAFRNHKLGGTWK